MAEIVPLLLSIVNMSEKNNCTFGNVTSVQLHKFKRVYNWSFLFLQCLMAAGQTPPPAGRSVSVIGFYTGNNPTNSETENKYKVLVNVQ